MVPILFALSLLTGQGPIAGPHARVTLVSEQGALQPGTENTIGLRFELDDGWHIYWENPGDSGAPPAVNWTLPAGFTTGDLIYPAPQRIQSGTIGNYGYEHGVLLMASLRVPKSAGAGAEVSANVRYIICREVCIPAKASPSIAIPVGGPAHATAAAPLFDAARAAVPQPAPAAWTATATIGKQDVSVMLVTGTRESSVEFFPTTPGIVNDSIAPTYEPTATGVTIRLKRSEQLTRSPSRFPFVIKRPDGTAITVTARVTAR